LKILRSAKDSMRIEAIKSIGRAKCFMCGKLIEQHDIQVRIYEFGGYTKSAHGSCIQDMISKVADKNYDRSNR